jgi:hypothetical protein
MPDRDLAMKIDERLIVADDVLKLIELNRLLDEQRQAMLVLQQERLIIRQENN